MEDKYSLTCGYRGLTEKQIMQRHKYNPVQKTQVTSAADYTLLEIRLLSATLTCVMFNDICYRCNLFFDETSFS